MTSGHQRPEYRVDIHPTRDECHRDDCDLTGFHFHWRGRVHRSAFDGSLTPDELDDFDADCRADVRHSRDTARQRRTP